MMRKKSFSHTVVNWTGVSKRKVLVGDFGDGELSGVSRLF